VYQNTPSTPSWLSEQVIGDSTIHQQLALLARRPSSTIVKFQAYDINGYTFYTRGQDQKTTHQNSGVHIDAMDSNNNKNSYYGVIEEIWELQYGPLNIPLFLCQWVKLTGGCIWKDQYGMTIVDLTKIGYKDEPFVLAENVHQVLYVKDMTSKLKNKNPEEGPQEPKRHIVLPGKRVIVGVEDRTDKSHDYDQFDGMPPSLSKLTQAYYLEMKRHRTYVMTMTKELSSRKETSTLYCND
jgi:hypothetical protein